MLSQWSRFWAKIGQAHQWATESEYENECMATLSESRIDWQCTQTWMKDSVNKSTCMWVKRVAESTTIRAKQFHACDNTKIASKIETMLGKTSIHVNDSKHSKKSRKEHSHKRIHKKRQKCWIIQVEATCPWIADPDVSKSPGCVVGCQSSKINVKEWALMHQINWFELMMCMPQI